MERHKKYWIAAAGLFLLLAFTGISTITGFSFNTLFDDANQREQTITDKYMLSTKNETTVIIHTYAGNVYTAAGNLDIIKAGTDKEETVLELNGSIKEQIKSEQTAIEKDVLAQEDTAVLTIYTEDEAIYGFYGKHRIITDGQDGTDKLELYGYLEAYYDGENYFSG